MVQVEGTNAHQNSRSCVWEVPEAFSYVNIMFKNTEVQVLQVVVDFGLLV